MSSRAGIVIYLLRNDLRLHDNEVLQWAHNHGSALLPLYCFDPRHYQGTWHFNLPKTGPFRLKFLLQSVRDLRNTLQKAGSNLIVRRGKPEVVVPELIQTLGLDNVKAVALQEEVTSEETDVENALQSTCKVPLMKFWGSTLYHKKDVPFMINNVPDVYTEFRKRVEGGGRVRNLCTLPDQLKPLPEGVEEGEIPCMADLGVKESPVDERSAFPFAGGESAALQRLNHYLWEENHVATYKETRNGLVGEDYSTKFSPWLSLGCLSPRKIFYEIKKYEKQRTANQSTYWVIFELIWRDYFKFVGLKYGNRIFYLGGIFDKRLDWKQDPHLFRAWKEGRTGVPFVDANMRELLHTGWMSNRGRQNVASFLTKDLKLDWRLGAEWFESMLVDHDVCSNYGNWLYSAGVGNDPRQDRKFNMVKQGLDYDPQGQFVKLWVPELSNIHSGMIHTPWNIDKREMERAGVSLGETYPKPVTVAPEWSRHGPRKNDYKDRRGKGSKQPPGKVGGIDFYFSSNSSGKPNRR